MRHKSFAWKSGAHAQSHPHLRTGNSLPLIRGTDFFSGGHSSTSILTQSLKRSLKRQYDSLVKEQGFFFSSALRLLYNIWSVCQKKKKHVFKREKKWKSKKKKMKCVLNVACTVVRSRSVSLRESSFLLALLLVPSAVLRWPMGCCVSAGSNVL